MTWAPAIRVDGDKVFFDKCGFSSLQNTVTDDRGRHFYKDCFIQGAVDFIWGGGQSVFQVNCNKKFTTHYFKLLCSDLLINALTNSNELI